MAGKLTELGNFSKGFVRELIGKWGGSSTDRGTLGGSPKSWRPRTNGSAVPIPKLQQVQRQTQVITQKQVCTPNEHGSELAMGLHGDPLVGVVIGHTGVKSAAVLGAVLVPSPLTGLMGECRALVRR